MKHKVTNFCGKFYVYKGNKEINGHEDQVFSGFNEVDGEFFPTYSKALSQGRPHHNVYGAQLQAQRLERI